MTTLVSVCQALSDPKRVDILYFIQLQGEATVQDVADALFGSPTNPIPVRRHLRVLREAGLVQRHKVGRKHYYRWSPYPLLEAIAQARDLFTLDA